MESNLTTAQKEHIRQVWNLFDKDGSGTIEIHELEQVMVEFGLNLTQSEIEQLLKDFDTNDDGEIDYDEFLSFMSKKLQDAELITQIFEAFSVFDQ